MNDDDPAEVVREAELTLYQTQWRIWEELALEQLAWTAGLGRAPLVPGSELIQLVTLGRGAYRARAAGHHAACGRALGGSSPQAGAAVRAVRQRGGRRVRARPLLR
jgi:hypothetical protein